jgi:predicted phage terminase large subunit-like protein
VKSSLDFAEQMTPEVIALMTDQECRDAARLLTAIEASELSADFRLFIPAAFRVLEPETVYQDNWHIGAMAEHLQAIHDGTLRNLIINIPPRHMKSIAVAVIFPAWEWTSAPSLKFICASYGISLAMRDSVKCRNLVGSPWYRARWPSFATSKNEDTKEFFSNTAGGYRIAAGVGGALSGRGADRLIVDDAHKTQEHESDLSRESVLDWWSSTMVSRVQDPRTVAKIIISQRVHERDLPGFLLEQGGWTHLKLPAEYREQQRVYVHADPPLTADPRTEEGALLWPERFGAEELAPFKRFAYTYSAQFQQEPTPAGGGIFKRNWWRFYTEAPRVFDEVIQSWDLAFKDADTSSYVVGLVLGRVGSLVYVLDRVRERLDFPATCRAITSLTERWPQAATKLVEDKANGPAVIAQLKATIPGLIPVMPHGTKEARAFAVSPFVESGNVLLPDPATSQLTEDFIDELASFPKGAHDDQVDAFTQGLDRLLIAVDGANQLIPFAAVERAVDRAFIVERGWSKTLSVVAGRETVISLRYGPVIRQQWVTQDLDELEAIAARVIELARLNFVPLVMVDTAGLGASILTLVRDVLGGARCRGFNPAEKARRDDRYDDRRTEVAVALRDEFAFDRISIPGDQLLVAQITGWRVGTTERGRARVSEAPGRDERAASVLAAFAAESSVSVATGSPAWL